VLLYSNSSNDKFRVDPSRILCRNDLDSTCHDSRCTYQHLPKSQEISSLETASSKTARLAPHWPFCSSENSIWLAAGESKTHIVVCYHKDLNLVLFHNELLIVLLNFFSFYSVPHLDTWHLLIWGIGDILSTIEEQVFLFHLKRKEKKSCLKKQENIDPDKVSIFFVPLVPSNFVVKFELGWCDKWKRKWCADNVLRWSLIQEVKKFSKSRTIFFRTSKSIFYVLGFRTSVSLKAWHKYRKLPCTPTWLL